MRSILVRYSIRTTGFTVSLITFWLVCTLFDVDLTSVFISAVTDTESYVLTVIV